MERFNYEVNGYKKDEVNKFVNDVINQTNIIIEKIKYQEREIASLRKKMEYYQGIEDTLNRTLKELGTLKENFNGIDEMSIENASFNADRIINNALLQAKDIENQRAILERNIKIFKKKLKSIVEQQEKVVEQIEVLELEEWFLNNIND